MGKPCRWENPEVLSQIVGLLTNLKVGPDSLSTSTILHSPPTVHISTILPPIPKITCMNTNFLLLFSLVIIQIPIQILVHTYLYNTLFYLDL